MIGNNISGYVIQESTAAALRSNTGASNGVNIVMLQQTGDNTHDRQQQQHQQPQELPQDAEPEPVVDNDSNQVIHLNSAHNFRIENYNPQTNRKKTVERLSNFLCQNHYNIVE